MPNLKKEVSQIYKREECKCRKTPDKRKFWLICILLDVSPDSSPITILNYHFSTNNAVYSKKKISSQCLTTDLSNTIYEDIFSENIEKQISISKVYDPILKKTEEMTWEY